MFRFNDRFNGRYINQFLKNLTVLPCTDYELRFDVLGGAVGCWVNHCFAKAERSAYYFERCNRWTTHTVRFTTNDRLEKQAAFENWGICFFKKMNSHYITGIEDTYIDNVRLVNVAEPSVALLRGGDFEEPSDSDIYTENWSMFLHPDGEDFGIEIAADPLDGNNRCLRLPRLIHTTVYPTAVPLQVSGFGYYKDVAPLDIHHFDPIGMPLHLMLLVERGEVVFRGEHAITVPAGAAIYLPPDTPVHFLFCAGKNTSYYWFGFYGSESLTLVQQAGIVPMQAFSPSNITAISSHIEELLQFPTDSPFYPHAASGCLQWCLAQLSRQANTSTESEQEQLIRRVAARLREQPELPANNAELAESCGFSVGHFIRLFKQYMGCTPHQYHLQERMKRACTLLRDTSMSVTEIALVLGVENPLYFSNLFRRVNGISPSEYRQQKKASV